MNRRSFIKLAGLTAFAAILSPRLALRDEFEMEVQRCVRMVERGWDRLVYSDSRPLHCAVHPKALDASEILDAFSNAAA